MTDSAKSSLDQPERYASFPRITELLSGNTMPSSCSAPSAPPSPFTPTTFETELPAFLENSPSPAQDPADLTRLDSLPSLPHPRELGELSEAVATAMHAPPVAMPAPVIADPIVPNPFTPALPLPLAAEASPARPLTPTQLALEPLITPEPAVKNEKQPETQPEIKTENTHPFSSSNSIADSPSFSAPTTPPSEPAPLSPVTPIEDPFITTPSQLEQEPQKNPEKDPEKPPPEELSQKSPEKEPTEPTPIRSSETSHQTAPSFPNSQQTLPGFEEIERNTTDSQLVEALLPIVESSLEKALYAPKTGLHMYLEPMLRATVRRAIAEQMQTIHHFGQISLIDRISWKLKALFTSRTYDDIVFERTHRYRVEEVYLLRYQSNSLISYASHDPSRHATPRKIKYDLSRLVEELTDDEGELRKSFQLPNNNTAVVRCGQNCFLLASIRGPINALARADLDYVLSQVEQRFGDRLRDQGQQFVHVLQPLLEGCLLIQSPPPPH